MQRIATIRDDIELYLLSAGDYSADVGAAMGVLPYKLWCDKVQIDEFHTLRMRLYCLLLKTSTSLILVDTGIGEYLNDRLKKIYRPSKFILIDEILATGYKPQDINYLVLTHLHFDHVGGIISENKELLFPKAEYIVQTDEWAIARKTDTLNAASYSLTEHYEILEQTKKVKTIEGSFELSPGIFIEKISGHSLGMQIVRIVDDSEVIYFAGDAFPTRFHLNPIVNSAYDISRIDMCRVKENIKNDLTQNGGKLILSHDIEEPIISFTLYSE
jgi:glyoxylase-like metal-dependent hydrolase (beta-lactamase superfamily II)